MYHLAERGYNRALKLFFLSIASLVFLPLLNTVYAKSPLTLLNNIQEGPKLLASIQVSKQAGLFIKEAPKSSSLTDLVISPLDATKSAQPQIVEPEVKAEILQDVKLATPSLSPSLQPSSAPTSPAPQTLNSGGLSADVLFSMVNSHRQSLNLPPFQRDERACTVAQARAPQVLGEIYGGIMHQGLKNMNLPYWNTENIISMRTNEEAFNWWIHDEIHKEAIEGNYKYSCVACSGNSCAEEFTDFTPK